MSKHTDKRMGHEGFSGAKEAWEELLRANSALERALGHWPLFSREDKALLWDARRNVNLVAESAGLWESMSDERADDSEGES